jgi:starch synthase
LPSALAELGCEVRTLLPLYPAVRARLGAMREIAVIAGLFGGDARLQAARTEEGAELLLLDAPHLYDRPGGPYQDPGGHDFGDNHRRFAALCWAAREIALGFVGDFRADVVHAHDWQAGLAPAYLALQGAPRPATVMTVHNLAYQGQFPPSALGELRLPPEAWSLHGVEYYGGVGFLKAGLFYADRITTVSPTYAREIQEPAMGMGLAGLLRGRGRDLRGILNGIDERVWDPMTDPHLPAPYSAHDLAGKLLCKTGLQERLGLAVDPDLPVFGVISRLTHQKGLDLLLEAAPDLVARGAQLALLGTGEPGIEAGFRAVAAARPGAVACVLGYDEALAHLIQGGADAILVPSRFEPCGLTQLCGLRYGTLPVVARVGGLADTVVDANEAALMDGVATGFQFAPVTAEALRQALHRALDLVPDRPLWQAMQRRAMTREVGWARSAARYLEVYREVAGRR